MATFNGEAFLPTQLASLVAQTRPPDELVISDDGSTDGTIAVIEAFARTASFPVVILKDQPRLQYRGNFMRAAQRCTGDWIAFCDQDDVWHPERIARSVAALEADDDVLLATHNARIISEAGDPVGANLYRSGHLPPLAPPLTLRPWQITVSFTQTISASLLPFVRYWPESVDPNADADGAPLAHDQFFIIAATSLGRIAYEDEPLADYRQHGKSVTLQWSRPSWQADLKLRLLDNSHGYERRMRSATHLAAMFTAAAHDREVTAGLTGAQQGRLDEAARQWSRIATLYDRRWKIYAERNPLMKLLSISRLVRDGFYWPGSAWTLGPKALVKDVVQGLLGTSLWRVPDREGRSASRS